MNNTKEYSTQMNQIEYLSSLCEESLQVFAKALFKDKKITKPSITIFPFIIKKSIIDMETFSDFNNNDCYDVIVQIDFKDSIKYIRWTQIFDLEDKVIDLSGKSELEVKQTIMFEINKYIELFTSGKIFDNLEDLYEYIDKNTFGRNNRKIKRLVGKTNITIEEYIETNQDLTILTIAESLNLRLSLQDTMLLQDFIICKLKLRKHSYNYVWIQKFDKRISFYNFSWIYLGTIKQLVIKWRKEKNC